MSEAELRSEFKDQLSVLEIALKKTKYNDTIRILTNIKNTIINQEKVRRVRNYTDYFLSKAYIMTFKQIDALGKKIEDYLYMIGE